MWKKRIKAPNSLKLMISTYQMHIFCVQTLRLEYFFINSSQWVNKYHATYQEQRLPNKLNVYANVTKNNVWAKDNLATRRPKKSTTNKNAQHIKEKKHISMLITKLWQLIFVLLLDYKTISHHIIVQNVKEKPVIAYNCKFIFRQIP